MRNLNLVKSILITLKLKSFKEGIKIIVGMPICPVLDFTCPYYEQGYCTLENPAEECDDYAMRYDDEEEDF